MGSLLRFPLSNEFVERFPVFIETGYGEGRSLSYAAQHPFEKLFSIEYSPDVARSARRKFADNLNVDIIFAHSVAGLIDILSLYKYIPIFFWLDAHFPGADYYTPLDKQEPEDIRLPLVKELEVIRNLCPDGNYFIAIDDLRFYADYEWGDGAIPPQYRDALPKERSLSFLNPFHSTHCVSIDLRDSGYALIGPHDAPFLQFTDNGDENHSL